MSMSSADGTEARRDALAVGLLRDAVPGLVAASRFGSSAAGAGRPGSDVDLVDLRAASTVMASQVGTTGILLYERDPDARHVFENFVYGRYARLNEERRGILERIAQEGTIYGG